jgi:hypothetical protein
VIVFSGSCRYGTPSAQVAGEAGPYRDRDKRLYWAAQNRRAKIEGKTIDQVLSTRYFPRRPAGATEISPQRWRLMVGGRRLYQF